MKRVLFWSGIGFFVFLSAADTVRAIPAFSRKYEVSCTQCHAPAPRLNRFGELFAAHGFRMEEPSQEPKVATLDVGDSLLNLAKEFPFSVRMEGFATYYKRTTQYAYGEPPTESPYLGYTWPWKFRLLSGGAMTRKISYYFSYAAETGNSSSVRDAYLTVNDAFGLPVDLKIGRFRISDQMFSRELRLEPFDYSVFASVYSAYFYSTLDYREGLLISAQLPGEVSASVGTFNGGSLNKSYSLRLSKSIGCVRIGLFGFTDKAEIAAYSPNSLKRIDDRIYYAGADLSIELGSRFHANIQYLERQDKNLYFLPADGREATSRGGFIEIHFFPQGREGRWIFSLLYNRLLLPENLLDPYYYLYIAPDQHNVSATMNYLVARDIRFIADLQRDLELDQTQASIGVSAAF